MILAVRNCKKCDIEPWCVNKDKSVCVMELEAGDIITCTITDPVGNLSSIEKHCTVIEVTKTQNLRFGKLLKDGAYEDTWGIDGIFVTDIKKEN